MRAETLPRLGRQGRAVFRIEPGPIYRFDGVTVSGTQRVKPRFIEKRFRRLEGGSTIPS